MEKSLFETYISRMRFMAATCDIVSIVLFFGSVLLFVHDPSAWPLGLLMCVVGFSALAGSFILDRAMTDIEPNDHPTVFREGDMVYWEDGWFKREED